MIKYLKCGDIKLKSICVKLNLKIGSILGKLFWLSVKVLGNCSWILCSTSGFYVFILVEFSIINNNCSININKYLLTSFLFLNVISEKHKL